MSIITDFVHASHPGHVLKLWSREEPYECNLCKEPGFGSRYACVSRSCNFHLRKECGRAPAEVSHELFPGCTLSLKPAPSSCSRVCSVCGRAVRGISYRCSHRDVRRAHDAHPRCLAHPRVITGDGGIQMRLSSDAPSECYRCRKKNVASMVKGFSYVSSCGRYCYHVACGGINRRPPAAGTSDIPRGNRVSSNSQLETPHSSQRRAPVTNNSRREFASASSNATRGTPVSRTACWTENQFIRNSQTETHVRSSSGTEIRIRSQSTSETLVRRNSGTETLVRNNGRPENPHIRRQEIRRLQQ